MTPKDLPSIPLTPKQRLFLASNTYEDKEAALQELLSAAKADADTALAFLARELLWQCDAIDSLVALSRDEPSMDELVQGVVDLKDWADEMRTVIGGAKEA